MDKRQSWSDQLVLAYLAFVTVDIDVRHLDLSLAVLS